MNSRRSNSIYHNSETSFENETSALAIIKSNGDDSGEAVDMTRLDRKQVGNYPTLKQRLECLSEISTYLKCMKLGDNARNCRMKMILCKGSHKSTLANR
ncbi:hypothetical protein LOAG_10558 [Loa loa]|uniref:Uncharacterized protein n=1 Tax=Loa loa TaxID=7209 RepID=A0A1S0TQW1_LOALO|nr:hypothetical protein LOAG_10558 [Loa loa]EFO17941.1 hypothetical protein LOAG_10558 [Loa loa]